MLHIAVPPRPTDRVALITRAIAAAWPVMIVMTVVWLLVPHAGRANDAAVVVLTAATAPLYLAVLLRRAIIVSRPAMNVVAVVGAVAVSGLVYAGGGLPSGFFLLALWFLPIVVCTLPGRDVALHAVLIAAGCATASALSVHMGGPYNGHGSLWGLGVVALATLVVNTTLVAYLFGRMRATTDDFQRRSAQDPLTGLANRTALHDRIDAMDLRASRAVYVIDVDGFKFVNDSLGHHAGDRLLVLVAERLSGHARLGDLLARPGGDEFVLVADGIRDDDGALAVGQRLADSCAEPFSLDGEEVEVSVTIGARRVADAATGEEALRDADLALYAAKLERRGTVKLFAASMRDAASSRMTLERHLRRALDRDELHVVYQPVVDITDSSIVGMEALLRWNCADLGPVSPAEFIPIAERTGLILPIGRFVLARAVEQLAAWQAAGHDVRMSVNLSASQLADEQLPDLLVELLETHRRPGRAAAARAHRVGPHAPGDRPAAADARAPALHRRGPRPRRLRHRLLVARPPQQPAPRRGEDRPLVHRRDGGRRRRPRRRHRRHADGRAAGLRGRRRGHRDREPARPAARARLPARPGLPLRPARAGGRGDRDARPRRGPGRPGDRLDPELRRERRAGVGDHDATVARREPARRRRRPPRARRRGARGANASRANSG